MKRRWGLVALAASVLPLALVSANPAGAASGPPGTTGYQWKVVNVQTYNNWIDFTTPVAGPCGGNVKTVCTFTTAKSVQTSVQVGVGASKSFVSATLGFSLTQTNDTSISCSQTVPVGKTMYAYRYGTHKYYNIQEWENVTGPYHMVAQSGTLEAFQPSATANAYCRQQ